MANESSTSASVRVRQLQLEALDLTPQHRASIEDLCDCCFPKPPKFTPVYSGHNHNSINRRPFPEFQPTPPPPPRKNGPEQQGQTVAEQEQYRPVYEIAIDQPEHQQQQQLDDPQQDDDDLLILLGTGEIDGTSLPELYASEEEEEASEGILTPKQNYNKQHSNQQPHQLQHQGKGLTSTLQLHQAYFLGFFQVLLSIVLFRKWNQDCCFGMNHHHGDRKMLTNGDATCDTNDENNRNSSNNNPQLEKEIPSE